MLIYLYTRRASDFQFISSEPQSMWQPLTYINLCGVAAFVPASYLTAHLLISFETKATCVLFFFLSSA
jgi:hypothetical protein